MTQGRTTDGWMHLLEVSVTTTLGNLEEMDIGPKNFCSQKTLTLLECPIRSWFAFLFYDNGPGENYRWLNAFDGVTCHHNLGQLGRNGYWTKKHPLMGNTKPLGMSNLGVELLFFSDIDPGENYWLMNAFIGVMSRHNLGQLGRYGYWTQKRLLRENTKPLGMSNFGGNLHCKMTMTQGRTTDGWMHLMKLSVATTLGNL